MSIELTTRCDVGAIAHNAYNGVRVETSSQYTDEYIAERSYCDTTSLYVTVGLTNANITTARSESHVLIDDQLMGLFGRPKLDHMFSVVPDPEGDPMEDEVFDCTYKQFICNKNLDRSNYFVGRRLEIVELFEQIGRRSLVSQLYLPSTDIVRNKTLQINRY
jgi:hypothetical protein